VKLVIPYGLLARDNERIGGMVRGRLLLSKRYRPRKDAMHVLARAQVKDDCLVGPIRLRGVAYWPDKRKRDLLFFAKGLHDALEGVCYGDDVQLVEVTYRVGGIDRANPRVELELETIQG
jgi:Holliday junction resolvase RusA-like endonuclease